MPIIVWNHAILAEGIDLPYLDAVVFFDPKESEVAVVQAVGRVLRKPPGIDKKAYVVMPVLYDLAYQKAEFGDY